MKRLLLICYYFPPLGGAGVARPLGLVHHLAQFGWECDILTVKHVAYRLYEPELLAGLGSSRIYRAGSTDPQRLLYMLGVRQVKDRSIEYGRELSDRFFPDAKIGWVRSAVRLGRTLASNRKYDAFLSTSPPISAHLVGMQLAKECRLPWIADFRDFWQVLPAEKLYKGAQLTQAQELLTQIKATSTAVTAVNDSISSYLGEAVTIHNSVDSQLISLWAEQKDRSFFTIGLLGTLNDLSPIEPLLQLVSAFREKEPELFHLLKIIHVGAVSLDWLNAQLTRYQLADCFISHGVQERRDTIRILNQAVLFYIGLRLDTGKAISTGRIFTLLSSGRPILAAVPKDGEVAKLINQSEAGGEIFSSDDVESGVRYLKSAIQQYQNGIFPKSISLEVRLAYSSEKMAERFAEVLNRVTSAR